jgi:hypothetical protein
MRVSALELRRHNMQWLPKVIPHVNGHLCGLNDNAACLNHDSRTLLRLFAVGKIECERVLGTGLGILSDRQHQDLVDVIPRERECSQGVLCWFTYSHIYITVDCGSAAQARYSDS